jgi:dTDP-4-amino-4,6-dideoxygalactose transaminase
LPFFHVQVQLDGELAGIEIVEVPRDVVAGLEAAIRVHGERLDNPERIDLRFRFHPHDFRAKRRQRLRPNWASTKPRKVRDPQALTNPEGPWSYELHDLGLNYRLPDINCALGLSQLTKLDRFLARRREIAAQYTRALAGLPGLVTPTVRADVQPGWHLYVVRVAAGAERHRQVVERLHRAGIGVQVHYIPVHQHPYYRRLGPVSLPSAEAFYRQCLSLPIFPAMTDDDIQRVVRELTAAMEGA